MGTNELLTADELAKRLRVRPDTVRNWARRNLIPKVQLTSKVIRFDFDAVVKAMAAARQTKREEDSD